MLERAAYPETTGMAACRVSPYGIRMVSFVCALAAGFLAGTVTIPAQRDATLIEDPNGALANGAGAAIFAGRTNQADDGLRRALLRFDLTPESASAGLSPISIESVAVVLTNTMSGDVAPREFRLHRMLADWGEGPSVGNGGIGAPAEAGDATWVHAFYPDVFFLHNGAQFDGEPSARLVVEGPGVYRFEGDGLRRDLAAWLREPDRNFGWILIGDETRPRTARSFGSREHPVPALRPVLEIRTSGGAGTIVRPATLPLRTPAKP